MNVLQIIINICSNFGLSGILLFLVKRHYEKKDEALKDGKQERKEIRDVIEKIAKQNDEQYAMIAHQDEKINSLCDDVKALKQQGNRNSQADRDMLRDAILRIYHRCYEVDGWITVNDLESLQHMYSSYIALGGNGMIPSIREKIISLPTVPPDNKS